MRFMAFLCLVALGFTGAFLHVRSSLHRGRFVGTRHEMEFVGGTILALTCLPAAIMMIAA